MNESTNVLSLENWGQSQPDNVQFLHYDASVTSNIGDILCSPKHYFNFESDQNVLIVGGGASLNFFLSRARRRKADVRIVWGVGQSRKFKRKKTNLLKRLYTRHFLPRTYQAISTRDPAKAGDSYSLVPCVSVFSPITNIPPGTRKGLFLNHNAKVSGGEFNDLLKKQIDEIDDLVIGTNSLPFDEFLESFAQTDEITTNSYHVAYWGLLSGRKIKLIGYSSKFLHLLELFDFKESDLTTYQRGDLMSLENALDRVRSQKPLSLSDPEKYKSEFRRMNFEFAASLQSFGISAALKPEIKEALAL